MLILSIIRTAALAPLALLLGFAGTAHAQDGGLMLHPTRAVFEDTIRSAQIELINTSTATATYRLRAVNRRMTDSGQFVDARAPMPGERFADGLFVFSPRQVTLAPGASQVVRIVARRPTGLAAGEYRSHLLFEHIAPAPAPSRSGARGAGISIELKPLVNVTIPVIVRQSPTQAQAAIGDVRWETSDRLSVALRRSGNRSIYGDLHVRFQPAGGQWIDVGLQKGVAVYVPHAQRRVSIPIAQRPAAGWSNGQLEVVFNERPEDGGSPLAATTVKLR